MGMKKLVLVVAGLLGACAIGLSSPTRADEKGEAWQRGGRTGFDHGSKMHSKIDCSACHKVSREQPDVKVFPGHAQCIVCHNFASETVISFANYCGVCHADKPVSQRDSKMFDFVTRTQQQRSDFGIDFSHVAHRKPLPQDLQVMRYPGSKYRINLSQSPRCDDCHARLEPRPANAPEMVVEKGHSSCFQCHGDGPHPSPANFPTMNQCAGCHELGGSGPASLSGKVPAFHHADHEFDTRPIRKIDFRKRPPDYLCAECHATVDRAEQLSDIKLPQEQTCRLCHNGRLGLPKALGADVLQQLRR